MTSLMQGPRRPRLPLVQKAFYAWYRAWAANPRFLRRRLAAGRRRVVLGCNGEYSPGWIPTDAEWLNLLVPEHWSKHFQEASLEALVAEHVWEHLEQAEARRAAKQCFDYLRPGGWLRIAVPDGHHPDPEYREFVRVGGSGPGSDDHRVLYTLDSLSEMLESVGFEVEPLEWFDADGEFHAQPWDPADGMVSRTRDNDQRNRDGVLRYTSLLVDARRPRS